jgi:hypothetical protein
MSERRELPNRRQCHSFNIQWQGNLLVITLGHYEDGAPAEVFVDTKAKIGTALDSLLRDVGVVLSFLMQHEAPLAPVLSALTRDSSGKVESAIGTILEHVIAEQPRLWAEAHAQLALVQNVPRAPGAPVGAAEAPVGEVAENVGDHKSPPVSSHQTGLAVADCAGLEEEGRFVSPLQPGAHLFECADQCHVVGHVQ